MNTAAYSLWGAGAYQMRTMPDHVVVTRLAAEVPHLCAECPWRRGASPGYYRTKPRMRAMARVQRDPCHMHTEALRAAGVPIIDAGIQARRCAGAEAYRARRARAGRGGAP